MSEQSPWGTPPPPSQPYGSPGHPTPTPQQPQQPWSSHPGGVGWSPPGGYGGGPGGPGGPGGYGAPGGYGGPPPKRRTGLFALLGVGAVAVVAAVVVTLVVAGGDEEAGPDDQTSSSIESSSSQESSSSAPAPDGDTIAGEGYSYQIPSIGWQDVSDQADDLGEGTQFVDSFLILGSSINLAQSSVIVEALPSGAAGSVEDVESLWKRNLASTDNATPVDIDDLEIDGERAIGVKIDDRVNDGGVPIKQVVYLTLHDGRQYSIGLTYPASGDTTSLPDFDALLSSWRWAA